MGTPKGRSAAVEKVEEPRRQGLSVWNHIDRCFSFISSYVSLRNASGQTAADLALAHGFHEGFLLLSKTQRHLQQLSGVHLNGEQNGNSTPGGQETHSRKRLLNAAEGGHMKRARRADSKILDADSPHFTLLHLFFFFLFWPDDDFSYLSCRHVAAHAEWRSRWAGGHEHRVCTWDELRWHIWFDVIMKEMSFVRMENNS